MYTFQVINVPSTFDFLWPFFLYIKLASMLIIGQQPVIVRGFLTYSIMHSLVDIKIYK